MNITGLFHFAFTWAFFTFLGVHYAHMKTPELGREIASKIPTIQPQYDASFKV